MCPKISWKFYWIAPLGVWKPPGRILIYFSFRKNLWISIQNLHQGQSLVHLYVIYLTRRRTMFEFAPVFLVPDARAGRFFGAPVEEIMLLRDVLPLIFGARNTLNLIADVIYF